MVIKINKSAVQKNKKQKLVVIVEEFELLVERAKGLVGRPIPYEDYIKNGKNNPEGDNLVLIEKGANQAKKESKSDSEPFEESKTSVDENSRINKAPIRNVQKVIPNNQKPPNQRDKEDRSSLSKDKPIEPKPKSGPIERVQPKREEPKPESLASRPKKASSEYTDIRSLYVGMDNWVVLGRIIAISPIKNFINKKGV
jgi:hypothetical protein